jgi:uncharacterized protein YyaL (SSP411 family)
VARGFLVGLAALALACSSAVAAKDTHTVDIAVARTRAQAQAFRWEPWSSATFERARREGRFILLHGAAVWCHWCHVMEETTYRDPEVGRILSERFVAIRVDIDARPDIAERYGEWGWPATILLGPDVEEIGKYRGYLSPDELRGILNEVERADREGDGERLAREPGAHSASVESLPWVARRALRDMDAYYDDAQGGWGMRQKAPLGENAEVEARRAALGDARARKRLVFTLERQRALIDPVWGGIYQYSTGGTWKEPHFEKLATYQAANLEAYARAFGVTRATGFFADARSIADYVERFLKAPDGAFLRRRMPTSDRTTAAAASSTATTTTRRARPSDWRWASRAWIHTCTRTRTDS